jgi:hypothetical protein
MKNCCWSENIRLSTRSGDLWSSLFNRPMAVPKMIDSREGQQAYQRMSPGLRIKVSATTIASNMLGGRDLECEITTGNTLLRDTKNLFSPRSAAIS